MGYTTEDTNLFLLEVEQDHPPVSGYRQKLICSGDLLEVEICPVWDTRPKGIKSKKIKSTRAQQKNQNEKNSRKRFVRLVNCNFTKNDYYQTNTYKNAPSDEQARIDAKNFIRRWQAARKKAGLGKGKYMFVTEGSENEKKQVHMHMLLEGGLDRDTMESLWGKGRANCRKLQPDDRGLTGVATYLSKDPKGKKRWGASRGLKEPIITYRKLQRSKAERIAKNENTAPMYFEKNYLGYQFLDMTSPKWSEYVSGFYLYARMRRKEAGEIDVKRAGSLQKNSRKNKFA